jgi:glyoxylase-like metal-dependent hydrolase (beta-lactamase superfamily II)
MPSSPARLSEIAPGVWVAQSRFYAQNSTVLLDGHGGAIVVDPAYYADELAAIPPDLAALGVRAVAGISTHMHYDHVLWHPDLGEVPRWSTPGTVRETVENRDAVVADLVGALPDDLVDLAARLTPYDGALMEWSGPTLRLHVHDAHAPHHLALELPDLGVLIAGDMLSDLELPYPADDDMDLVTYRTGLESLGDVVRRSRVLVPGHGSVSTAPVERWDADRRYLDDLEVRGISDDPRIGHDDMAELHAANVRRGAAARVREL